jgi:putative mRNA 3-end processing factor
MEIKILGAAKEVGRSAFLVSNENSNILMDYGVLLKKEPQFPLHVKPKDLHGIVLSHAHLDHSGFLPSLFLSSSKFPVLSTNPTIELSQLLIEDMIKISGFYLPFENIDLDRMLKSHKNLQYREPYNINETYITLYESGHVLGGSTIVVENKGKRVFYTGDINTRGSKILRPADLDIDEIHLMIIESTYSQTNQLPRPQSEKELLEFAYKIIDNGGTLFVPAFSVERAQEIACVFKAYKFPHKIVMDGMALKVNEIMLKYPEYIRDPIVFKKYIEEVEWIRDWKSRRSLIKEPCVIISPAGMLVGGSAIFYMQNIMMSDKNGIALVSYQGENTPGRMLLEKGTFKINGKIKKCLAEVNPKVLTVHGDGNSCIKFAEEITEKYGFEAIAPNSGDTFKV